MRDARFMVRIERRLPSSRSTWPCARLWAGRFPVPKTATGLSLELLLPSAPSIPTRQTAVSGGIWQTWAYRAAGPLVEPTVRGYPAKVLDPTAVRRRHATVECVPPGRCL
jgi:hypothetical protein